MRHRVIAATLLLAGLAGPALAADAPAKAYPPGLEIGFAIRSEEHTSELQSH